MTTHSKPGHKYVFFFGDGDRHTEGDASLKALLGSKGASLAELSRANFPVPPGFTLSTEVCAYFTRHDGQYPPGLTEQLKARLHQLETLSGRRLGDPANPLLLAVRPSVAVGMPGLAETVLNLGLNDRTLAGLAAKTGDARAAWDCYRRLIASFGPVVAGPASGLTAADFQAEHTRLKRKYGIEHDTELTAGQLQELCDIHKKVYFEKVRKPFPQDPQEQLKGALNAVLLSWSSDAAERYRQANRVTGLFGAAVSVGAMVFGNLGEGSAAGMACTRHPGDGSSRPTGRYLPNAQGGDLCGGSRPPKDLQALPDEGSLVLAKAYEPLLEILARLERECRYPQEVEFTVQSGRLWLLQHRNARRSGAAGLRWAVEMATGRDVATGRTQERILKPQEALLTVTPGDLEQVLAPPPAAKGGGKAKKPPFSRTYRQISDWSDQFRRMKVRADVDGAADARAARQLGAEGLGVCRTERMLLEGDRLAALRECLLGDSAAAHEKALRRLLAPLRAEFEELFEAMDGLPVIVRLAEPPLPAILGMSAREIERLATRLGVPAAEAQERARSWRQAGPRPAMSAACPALWALQTRAVLEAACAVEKRKIHALPDLVLPPANTRAELDAGVEIVRAAAHEVLDGRRSKVRYRLGASIETPRAALVADALAEVAEFFVFDVRELTRTAFGLDAPAAGGAEGPAADPFQTLDAAGVGQLLEGAVRKGRSTRPDLMCGVCGGLGADAAGVRFFGKTGIDFVSCPPAHVPLARLAAAQAAIKG